MENINYKIPESTFEIVDTPVSKSTDINAVNKPVFVCAFSSDKGYEKQRYVQGSDFFKIYGDKPSFVKHGQPLLQAARTINAGAKVLVKRIVADDAWLANTTLVAFVSDVKESAETDAAVVGCKVRYQFVSLAAPSATLPYTKDDVTITNYRNCTLEKVSNDVKDSITPLTGEVAYPLFTITETGRGTSAKAITISPNYKSSKNLSYMSYTLTIYEDYNNKLETLNFSLDHETIDGGMNRSIENIIKNNSLQIQCKAHESYIDAFFEAVYTKLNVLEAGVHTVDSLKNSALLFGKNKTGTSIISTKLQVAVNTIDSVNTFETSLHELSEGSNGVFGARPIESIGTSSDGTNTGNEVEYDSVTTKKDEYTKQLCRFFSGEYSNDIWDLDNYKFDAIVDANYPEDVKKQIGILADWRDDILYFRDAGITGMTDEESIINKIRVQLSDVEDKYSTTWIRSRCIADYPIYYDVIDAYTKKQITVTIGYSLANLLVNHFANGKCRPFAGQQYNVVIPEAIEGTVNFIPKNLRTVNQKEAFIDNKINYLNYYDGILTVETLYTSQELDTEFDYINNVLAIQEVIKAVRTRCPLIRYSFVDNTENLENYKKDVESVLDDHSINFAKLEMVYLEDSTMIENKVFYAAIQCAFRNFVQKEYFKIYPIEI